MPRPNGLRTVSERPATDAIEPGSPLAHALEDAAARVGMASPVGTSGGPMNGGVAPDQLLAQLSQRYQAELADREQRHRVELAQVAQAGQEAIEQSQVIRGQAVEAVNAAVAKAAAAEEQRVAAARMLAGLNVGQKVAERVGRVFSRLPLLLVLIGSYLLWQATPGQSWPELVRLGLFGLLVVGPTIWLSTREGWR